MPAVILGIKIHQDPESVTISHSQQAFLERNLDRFGMADCNPKPTPGIDINDDVSQDRERPTLHNRQALPFGTRGGHAGTASTFRM